jgi:hypothetical protein
MNKIFERIIEVEDQLNSLIEDLNIEVEFCPKNKDEIEHELIVASRAVSRVYSLNIDNMEGYRDYSSLSCPDQQTNDQEEGFSP